jgi:hypothetical protein
LKFKIVGIFFLVNLVHANSSVFDICLSQSCDVVVDAGFSGTRVHVYTYKIKTFQQDKKIKQIYQKKIQKSFTQYEPARSHEILESLFADFPKHPFSVYFYATEGYRSLNFIKQIIYSKAIRQWFYQQPYLNLREIRKISGKEEATYAWISHYLHTLEFHNPNFSLGIIEIGGGSAQVAFIKPGISTFSDRDNQVIFNGFDNHLISLWVKSLNQYGRDKMSKKVQCKPPILIDSCINDFIRISSSISSDEVNQVYQALLPSNPQITWYGLGLLSYIGRSALINNDSEQYILSELKQKANQQICQVSLTSIQNSIDPYAKTACFNSAYIYALTHELFGLKNSTKIHFHHQSNGHGWPEGSIIWRLLKS